jgi:hypothetical protein
VEKLQMLNTLLEMTKEAERLASEGEQMERIKTLSAEIQSTAHKEYARVRGGQGWRVTPNPTRYELCMIGIREELSHRSTVIPTMPAWSASFGRIHEEIDRTIKEIKAKHTAM